MNRTYATALDRLEAASNRVKRLFALACYEHTRSVVEADKVIKFVDEDLMTAENGFRQRSTLQAGRKKLEAEAQLAREVEYDALRSQEAGGEIMFQKELAHELILLCISDSVKFEKLASCVWGIRCFKGKQSFDEEICKDLDFCGPDKSQRNTGHNLSQTTIRIAEACYNGDWSSAPILADALEEFEDVPRTWSDHLRSAPRHWQGCWVVDSVLGRR